MEVLGEEVIAHKNEDNMNNVLTVTVPAKPKGYENDLREYAACFFDGICGEPVGWGFKLVRYLGEDRFHGLEHTPEYPNVRLECGHGYPSNWYLIAKHLTREEAIQKYGKVTEEIFGPRGGWKSVTFGDKKFGSDCVAPERGSY